jgi:hypothetical protein
MRKGCSKVRNLAIHKSASGFSGITRVMVFIDGGYLRKQLKDMFDDDFLDVVRAREGDPRIPDTQKLGCEVS